MCVTNEIDYVIMNDHPYTTTRQVPAMQFPKVPVSVCLVEHLFNVAVAR